MPFPNIDQILIEVQLCIESLRNISYLLHNTYRKYTRGGHKILMQEPYANAESILNFGQAKD